MGIKLSKYGRKRPLSTGYRRSAVYSQPSASGSEEVVVVCEKQSVDSSAITDKTIENQKNPWVFRNLELINALNFEILDDEDSLPQPDGCEGDHPHSVPINNNSFNSNSCDGLDNNCKSIVSFALERDREKGAGCLQTNSMEILLSILTHLTVKDILTLQSVSKFWYMLIKDDMLWKSLVKRDIHNKWNYQLRALMSKYETQNNVNWKKIYCDQWRTRLCGKCTKTYRQCFNQNLLCKVHTGIRDIVENRGVPSGVYWLCCLAKPKNAEGCTSSSHHEDREITNLSYYYSAQ